jgi:hypothetical protein
LQPRAGGRAARLQLTLDGLAAPVTVPLTAAATVPTASGKPSPEPTGIPAPPLSESSSTSSAVALTGARALGRDRAAALATLTCNAAVPCQVKAARRVRLAIAGRRYGAWVLAPASLGPGESAPLSVRLSGRGAAALLGVATTVRVRVWIGAGEQFEVEEIEARVVGAVPAAVPLAKRRSSPSPQASVTALRKEAAR